MEMCAEEDRSLSLYNSDWQDIEVYGKTVLERISISEVYELCKKAVVHYAKMTQSMELFLMKEAGQYQKSDDILAQITSGTVEKKLLSLFDYIYML